MSDRLPDRPEAGLGGHLEFERRGAPSAQGRGASAALRVSAFVIDWVVIGLLYGLAFAMAAVLGILSFGLLWAPAMAFLPALPLAYHTLFVASHRHATPGQRLVGLHVVSVTDATGPGWVQALIATALFYASIGLTGGLILLWCLFDDKGRCLHDILSGTQVMREA